MKLFRDSSLSENLLRMGTGRSGKSFAGMWPSTPYSSFAGILCLYSTPLLGNDGTLIFPSASLKYKPEKLSIPYC